MTYSGISNSACSIAVLIVCVQVVSNPRFVIALASTSQKLHRHRRLTGLGDPWNRSQCTLFAGCPIQNGNSDISACSSFRPIEQTDISTKAFDIGIGKEQSDTETLSRPFAGKKGSPACSAASVFNPAPSSSISRCNCFSSQWQVMVTCLTEASAALFSKFRIDWLSRRVFIMVGGGFMPLHW